MRTRQTTMDDHSSLRSSVSPQYDLPELVAARLEGNLDRAFVCVSITP